MNESRIDDSLAEGFTFVLYYDQESIDRSLIFTELVGTERRYKLKSFYESSSTYILQSQNVLIFPFFSY